MTKKEYQSIEEYMLECMKDSAHDKMHVYRVLYMALDIGAHEADVDFDVLIAACLLHDVGRERQAQDLELDHAEIGAVMAHDFLLSIGWAESRASHVKDCVLHHRYRKGDMPVSIEAKIVFDADKLDVTGAVGIARTLIYGGQVTEPLYVLDDSGDIIKHGGGAEISSFVQEYNYKLGGIYDRFYTDHARALAQHRKRAATHFYQSLMSEIEGIHGTDARHLQDHIQ